MKNGGGGCGPVVLRLLLVSLMRGLVAAQGATATVTSSADIVVTQHLVTTQVTGLASQQSWQTCDGVGQFVCPTGTCYTGYDGFVGCCSVSSCAARTTCIPFVTGLQTCNVDVGGCVVCPAGAPACVTVTNIVNSQHIWYCDASPTIITLSYTNLVSTGSMALPPGANAPPAVTVNTSTRASSTSSVLASTTPITTLIVTASDYTPINNPEVSRGAIAGITVGSVILLVAITGIAAIIIRRQHKVAQHPENDKPGPFRPESSINSRTASSMILQRRLAENSSSRDGPVVGTIDAENADGYVRRHGPDRPGYAVGARDAACVYEVDGSNNSFYLTSALPVQNPQQASEKNWGRSPATKSDRVASASISWPLKNAAPSDSRANRASRNYEQRVSELSSIRHVQPSGTFRALPSPTDVEAATPSVYPVSPNTSTFLQSPLVGGLSPPTPLMDQWTTDDRASVGHEQIIATAMGPVSWPSPLRIPSRAGRTGSGSRGAHGRQGIARGVNSATGMQTRYVSPESAMAEGLYGAVKHELP